MNALLLVSSRSLQDGLDALLSSMPEVQLIAHSNDAATVFDFCRQNDPELVVIEVSCVNRDSLSIVRELMAISPKGFVLALYHDEDGRTLAEQSQVDRVLPIGTPASKLKAVIEDVAHSTKQDSE